MMIVKAKLDSVIKSSKIGMESSRNDDKNLMESSKNEFHILNTKLDVAIQSFNSAGERIARLEIKNDVGERLVRVEKKMQILS